MIPFIRPYCMSAILIIFAVAVALGADPSQPEVLVPFLVAEAIAIAIYVHYLLDKLGRR